MSTVIFGFRLWEFYVLKAERRRLMKLLHHMRLWISNDFLRVSSVVCRPQCFIVWSRLAENHLQSSLYQKHSRVFTWPNRHIFPLAATDQWCAGWRSEHAYQESSGDQHTLSRCINTHICSPFFNSFIITVDKYYIYQPWQLKERKDDTNRWGFQRTNRAVCKKSFTRRSGRQVRISAVWPSSLTTNHDKLCQVHNFCLIEPPFESKNAIYFFSFLNKIVHKFRYQGVNLQLFFFFFFNCVCRF